MKKALFIIVITILIIFSGLLVWLRYGVDQEQIQSILADTLGPDYIVEIDSARIYPLQRAVSIGHMAISTSTDGHILFQTDTLHISGMRPSLLFRKNITLSELRMSMFTIDWNDSLVSGDEESGDGPSVRKLEVQSLDLTDGTLIAREEGGENKRMNNLNLKADFSFEFMTESDSLNSPQHRIAIDSLGFLFSEDRYQFSLSGVDYEHQDSLLTISSLKLTPIGGYAQFMSSLEYQTNMVEMEITDFTASGIDPAAYRNQKIIKARSLDFDGFNIHVAKNKQLSENPDKENPTLVNESIQKLPFAIQLDSLFFRNTNIQYSEQDEDGTRPGTVSFMNSTIQLREVNSLSPSPAFLSAVTSVQSHSELSTDLNFTLHDGPFRLTGSGNLQPFDLREFNTIFMDLEGIEIESGFAHELDFYFDMIDDTSSGRMQFIYENLKIKNIDKDDYDVSFVGSIKSSVANNIILISDNVADPSNEVRTGEIDHVRKPESPFFQTLWHSLRSGIYDIVLRI